MQPLISVVTACFNAAGTIADTLHSVKTQSYPAVEHIVIDGGSTDGTQDIVRALSGPGDQLVSEPDRGIYDAMNKGIAQARGSIIGLLNADDVFADSAALGKVAAAFDSDARLDAVLGDIAYYQDLNDPAPRRRYNSGRFRPGLIAWGWMPAHPGMYLTRAAYDRVGPYATDYRIAGDFEFVARAFGRVGLTYRHLPETLVKMRIGGVSTSGIRSKLRINREVVRACKANGIYTNHLMVMSKYPMKLAELLR